MMKDSAQRFAAASGDGAAREKRARLELPGQRVLLRDHAVEDWHALAAYQMDRRYSRFGPPGVGSPEHARKLVELFLGWAREEPRRCYQLGIVHRATGRLIGSCGIRLAGQPRGSAEFGLELAPDWWGHGLAAEASRLLLGFGFERLALESVVGVSVSENARVGFLVRRLGFVQMGVRPGDAWMKPQGWTYAEWKLTREKFGQSSG